MSKEKRVWTKEELERQKVAAREMEMLRKNPRLMLAPYEELTAVEPKPKKYKK